jgi:hypothetical protein
MKHKWRSVRTASGHHDFVFLQLAHQHGDRFRAYDAPLRIYTTWDNYLCKVQVGDHFVQYSVVWKGITYIGGYY